MALCVTLNNEKKNRATKKKELRVPYLVPYRVHTGFLAKKGATMAAALPQLFVAVDTPELAAAERLASALNDICTTGIKLGLEFYAAHGPAGVRSVMAQAPGAQLFLDLKFHDIPNTVAGAVRAVVPLGATVINVHAGGGPTMMKAAVAAAAEAASVHGVPRPCVLAVTVLTSLDDDDLSAVGQSPPVHSHVVRLARLAQQCGMDGVVCSAKEIQSLRDACGKDFALIVPGIRPAGSVIGDQKRVMQPSQAIAAGATSLVVGRPITGADDPRQVGHLTPPSPPRPRPPNTLGMTPSLPRPPETRTSPPLFPHPLQAAIKIVEEIEGALI